MILDWFSFVFCFFSVGTEGVLAALIPNSCFFVMERLTVSGSFETAFFFLRVLGRKQLMQVPITSHGVKAALFQDS